MNGGSEADPGKDKNKQTNKATLVQVCHELCQDDCLKQVYTNILYLTVDLVVEKDIGPFINVRC